MRSLRRGAATWTAKRRRRGDRERRRWWWQRCVKRDGARCAQRSGQTRVQKRQRRTRLHAADPLAAPASHSGAPRSRFRALAVHSNKSTLTNLHRAVSSRRRDPAHRSFLLAQRALACSHASLRPPDRSGHCAQTVAHRSLSFCLSTRSSRLSATARGCSRPADCCCVCIGIGIVGCGQSLAVHHSRSGDQVADAGYPSHEGVRCRQSVAQRQRQQRRGRDSAPCDLLQHGVASGLGQRKRRTAVQLPPIG